MSGIVKSILNQWKKKDKEGSESVRTPVTTEKKVIQKPSAGYASMVDEFIEDIKEAYGLEQSKAREFYMNHHLLPGIMAGDRDSIGNYVRDNGTTTLTYMPVAIGMGHYQDLGEDELKDKVIEVATNAKESGVRFSAESLDKVIENPEVYIEISREHFSK